MHNAYPGEFSGVTFLAKPFSPQELITAVRDCVESERAEAGAEA
jgi:FixJ family two-component response regulator